MVEISIHQGHTPDLGAADARVVIDVIRAFTTTQVAFARGAEKIVLAKTLDDARRLARTHPDRILAGERNALAPDDFDLGNSPAQCDAADLDGKSLVLTTSHGVQATLHAWHDGPVVVTGFANAGTTVRYLRRLIDDGAQTIQLLASHPAGDEDLACAEWIRARLVGDESPGDEEVRQRIIGCDNARKFLDPDQADYRADDIDYCARRADSEWAMVVSRGDEGLVVTRCSKYFDGCDSAP